MAATAKETLETMLGLMGFEAAVEQHTAGEDVILDIKCDDSGRLIGRQGQTLADLQYITNRILYQQDPTCPKIQVDVSGYRAEAREVLVKKALEAADKVRRFGDIIELEPLTAFERRIVHNAIKEDPDIETHSVEVEGTDKKVVLLRPRR